LRKNQKKSKPKNSGGILGCSKIEHSIYDMTKPENLLEKIGAEIISPSHTKVRVNGQIDESSMAKLKEYNIIVKKENDYHILSPSDGESRQMIADYIAKNKGKLRERYSD